jgi:hypothetical protein
MEDWWSVLVNKNSSTEFTVYAKNSLYNGDDGNTLGFQASSTVTLLTHGLQQQKRT